MPRVVVPLVLAMAALFVVAGPAQAKFTPPVDPAQIAEAPPVPDDEDGQRGTRGGAPAGAATAARALPVFWATVNICDTTLSPDSLGVRASMPGNGLGQRMHMRFNAEWWSPRQQQWLPVPGAQSPWANAGPARYRSAQLGWTFEFNAPPEGKVYLLRGTVDYEWRSLKRSRKARKARWVTAMKRERVTKTGIKGVDAGDPVGTSKALCIVI